MNATADLKNILYILSGCFVTLEYMLLSLIGGTILGLCLALCKIGKNRFLYQFAQGYTSIFRGTPLLVQLSIVYFGVPQVFHCKLSALGAGVLAFSLNSGAYLSEVIRAGVASIDRGQFEAARVLQIPYFYTMRDIIFPQALKNTLPSLANEAIDLLKETALISTLGEEDLMRRSQLVAAEQYTYFAPLLVAAAGYYCMILMLSFLFKKIESKFV
jgi:polar amino acid transport system permease protein